MKVLITYDNSAKKSKRGKYIFIKIDSYSKDYDLVHQYSTLGCIGIVRYVQSKVRLQEREQETSTYSNRIRKKKKWTNKNRPKS